MAVCTVIVGLGLVVLLIACFLLAHGYLVMGYRTSGEPAASLTGRAYGAAWSRSLMRFYVAALAFGLVVAALGLVGLLVTWALSKLM